MIAAPEPMRPLGPYETWVYGPGRDYDLPQLWLQDPGPISAVAEVAPATAPPPPRRATRPDPSGPAFLIPTLYRQNGLELGFVPFLIDPPPGAPKPFDVLAQAGALQGIRRLLPSGEAGKLGVRLNFPLRQGLVDPAFPREEAEKLPWSGPRPKVVIAVIDEGIPFAHSALRRADGGTRVACCWSQAAPPAGDGAVLFGREFTSAGIDQMVTDLAHDEDAIYAAAGLTTRPGEPPMPLGRAISHGAFVADLLAGDWPGATAGEVAIIAVDLPATVSWDTSGFGKDMFVLAALHYVFERAERLAEACGTDPLPLVVNISYGHTGGPGDSSALLPAAFDQLVAARRSRAPTAMVIPTGNSYLGRLHSVLGPSDLTNGPARLDWVLPPDDRTSTFAEVWFPPGLDADAAGATVALHAPSGQVSRAMPGQPAELRDLRGRIVGRLAFERYRGQRWRVVATLAPTAPVRLDLPAMVAGTWGLEISLANWGMIADPTIHVRIQRDAQHQRTGARQSWFREAAAPQYGADGAPATVDPSPAARLRRSGTLNGLATGQTTIVVAGHVELTGHAAPYSGAGEVGQPPAVCVSAASDRSSSRPGLFAGGTRSGIASAQRGTSSAAPLAARHLAENFRTSPPAPGPSPDNYASHLAANADPYWPGPGPGEGPDSIHRLGQFRLARPTRG